MSRQQHTSSDERLLLISLFKEKASVLLSKKTEGKKALSKAKAWEDITSALNAAALGPPRSVKQTKKLWENMKGRAKKLYRNESNRTDGSGPPHYCDMISAKVIDIIIKDLNSDTNSKDLKNESTCGMDDNETGCSGVSQLEICCVREEGQESFMDVNAEDEGTLGSDYTADTDVNKTVGHLSPADSDSLDLGDSRISSIPNMQDPLYLPPSELGDKKPTFSDCQVSDIDENVSTAADQLSIGIEGPKMDCGLSTEATTSRAATPLRKRLKFSEGEWYNTSAARKNKEHEIIMNVQKAKLQAQEAKLKHLDKQELIDAEKLKQMQMQSLLNAHLLESVTQWKEVAVSVQETVEKLKNFYQGGETSMADKNFSKGTPVTKKSGDGSVHLKPKESSSSVLECLYEDSAFADVTLTAQGQSVRAHRAVLSAKSLYFREVLQASPYQHPIIIMPLDVQFRDLQAIISYIYKGEITLPSENLKSLLKTADALQISDLARVDVLGMTAIDSEAIASCKTERVHSQTANSINEQKEDMYSELSLPVITRKDKLHSNRAECDFLLSSRKRPREEAFSETELVMSDQTLSKSPRLAENNDSATPDGTSVLAEAEVEDFEEHEVKVEDFEEHEVISFRMPLLLQQKCLNMSGRD
ncbi:uncharacterized protein LOC125039381 isoform X2 [Penaeus chinensis]|uniref:uncharacterized protein LOC125039381 isoform X2 n=1 Tax=Penaeus chinensis TaxID=139456 RepID=UPI001FB76A8D|nr:uncharacterized protein LOC125039381 isoform X2 [Penaeus chinensis]